MRMVESWGESPERGYEIGIALTPWPRQRHTRPARSNHPKVVGRGHFLRIGRQWSVRMHASAPYPVQPVRGESTPAPMPSSPEKIQNSWSRHDRCNVLTGFSDAASILSSSITRHSLDATRDVCRLLGARSLLGRIGLWPGSASTRGAGRRNRRTPQGQGRNSLAQAASGCSQGCRPRQSRELPDFSRFSGPADAGHSWCNHPGITAKRDVAAVGAVVFPAVGRRGYTSA